MTDDESTEEGNSEEEFTFGVDFSSIDVSTVEFPDDRHDDVPETDESELFARRRCFELVSRRFNDIMPQHNPSCDNNDVSELFQWATDQGATLDHVECLGDAFGGRGLYMKSDHVAAGDVVATLPRSLRIGQNHACRQLGLPKGTADLSALSLMVVDAMVKNEIFAKCLPRHCSNAVFMTANERSFWAGCGEDYSNAIVKVREQAESCVNYIQDCVLNSDQNVIISNDSAIWWAIAMVQSRTHGFGSNKSRWMTPIFDFCNHSENPNCRLEGDAEGNLTLKASRSIHNGEEITIDYQVPDDAKLVATYGFSLKLPTPNLQDAD